MPSVIDAIAPAAAAHPLLGEVARLHQLTDYVQVALYAQRPFFYLQEGKVVFCIYARIARFFVAVSHVDERIFYYARRIHAHAQL